MVWQRNRYGQICYPAFVPFNPRSPAQTGVRGVFATVSARWRTLTQEQRDLWIAVASTMKTKPRLDQCGVLPGFNLFIKVNVPLANRGLAQVDLPPEGSRKNAECRKTPTSNLEQPSSNNQRVHSGPPLDVGFSMSDLGCYRGSRGGKSPLRYRSCSRVPPYLHRSSTLGGRPGHRCPQKRLRFPCRSQPPRCRGAPALPSGLACQNLQVSVGDGPCKACSL
jgi:hypothetical protein